MNIAFGNLSVEQIEARINIKLSEEDKETLNSFWENTTANVRGHYAWHCFDAPFFISCGNYKAALKVREIFSKYAGNMRGELQISGDWEGAPEPDTEYKYEKLKNLIFAKVGEILGSCGDDPNDIPAYVHCSAAPLKEIIESAGLYEDFVTWLATDPAQR